MNSDVRVAPNIFRSRHGWRVYVRRDGKLKPIRFKGDVTLEQLEQFRDSYKDESEKIKKARRAQAKERAGTLAGDADRYLALKTVKAMPSFTDRKRDIERWASVFGKRPRPDITARDLEEQLQAWYDAGVSGSTVNKRRTALMSLYTRLDGRSAANPVKDTRLFPESDEVPRGQPLELLERILASIDADRTRPKDGSRKGVNKARPVIDLMLATGMAPIQIHRLRPHHYSTKERWYVFPRREKGRQPKHPRPMIRKPMTKYAVGAFERFAAANIHGDFDRRAVGRTWARAVKRTARELGKENPQFEMPHIRLYDIRHSFATAMLEATNDERLVQRLLDQSSGAMVRRYSLGAIPKVLKDGVRRFEKATRAARRRRPKRRAG